MLTLDMIEELEQLLADATASPDTPAGRAALHKAAHLWHCFAAGMRAGLAHVAAMSPDEREQLRHRLLVDFLVPTSGRAN